MRRRRNWAILFVQTVLSSVLNSKTAIQINMAIMRTFVAIRQSIAAKPSDKLAVLQHELSELKSYLEEVFTDQNDINEDTRMQIELINHRWPSCSRKNRKRKYHVGRLDMLSIMSRKLHLCEHELYEISKLYWFRIHASKSSFVAALKFLLNQVAKPSVQR